MMQYSEEFKDSIDRFLNACDSDSQLCRAIEADDAPPFTKDEQDALEFMLSLGDPRIWDFMTKFMKSQFIQDIVKHY